MLRIGCVKYLNARPLITGWPDPVVFDHPSVLCRQLAQGDLDVALVSSFEFLRHPIYRIVDDISISSRGAVYSVVLVHIGEISEIEEVELDPASETSANLLRCLLAERGLTPRFTSVSSSTPARRRARLLIGDQAIEFRNQHVTEFNYWDLGEQWKALVDLPFVYALWLVRPEIGNAKEVGHRLRALRDQNLERLDGLITDHSDPEFCARYYREHLRFTFGEDAKAGLQSFANVCAKHRLLPQRDLFLDLV